MRVLKLGIKVNVHRLKLYSDLCINLFNHKFAQFGVLCGWIVYFALNDEDEQQENPTLLVEFLYIYIYIYIHVRLEGLECVVCG